MTALRVRDYRVAAGVSLQGKVRELGFFLKQICEVSREIEGQHAAQRFPLNDAVDRLNFYFSAFMNSVQGLKDVSATAMDLSLTWAELSPTYGDFIFYCRNAITHDGTHLVNGSWDAKHFIVGPLRRLDDRKKVKELDPPKEDVVTVCRNITSEVLKSLRALLSHRGGCIPTANGADFQASTISSLDSDFMPVEIKALMRENLPQILESVKDVRVEVVPHILAAIASVESEEGLNDSPQQAVRLGAL